MTEPPEGSKARFVASSGAALKVKLLSGDAEAPLVDPRLVDAANERLQALRDEFPVWARAEIARLESAAAAAPGDFPMAEEALRPLIAFALGMRGAGATMGYPLFTQIATSLLALLQSLNGKRASSVARRRWKEAVRVHAQALDVILRDRMSGDGGPAGRRVLNDFAQLLEKTTGPGRK